MRKTSFKLRSNEYLEVDVRLVSIHQEEGEPVHRETEKANIILQGESTHGYSKVSCGLQSAVCTALDAIISALPEKKKVDT